MARWLPQRMLFSAGALVAYLAVSLSVLTFLAPGAQARAGGDSQSHPHSHSHSKSHSHSRLSFHLHTGPGRHRGGDHKGHAHGGRHGSGADRGHAQERRRSVLSQQPRPLHLSSDGASDAGGVPKKRSPIILSRVRQGPERGGGGGRGGKKGKGKKGRGGGKGGSSGSSWALKTDSFWGERRRPKKLKIQIRLGSKARDGAGVGSSSFRGKGGAASSRGSGASAGAGGSQGGGRFSTAPRSKTPVTSLPDVTPRSGAALPVEGGGLGLGHPRNRKVEGPAAATESRGAEDAKKILRFGAGAGDGSERIGTGAEGVHSLGIGIGHHPPGLGGNVPRSQRVRRGLDVGDGTGIGAGHQAPGFTVGKHHPPGPMVGHHRGGGGRGSAGLHRQHPSDILHQRLLAGGGTRSLGRHHAAASSRARLRNQATGTPGSPSTGGVLAGQTCNNNQTVCDTFAQTNPGWDTCCG